MSSKKNFDCGLIIRNKDETNKFKVTKIKDTVGVCPSLLTAPLCVLHSKAASKINRIEVSWEQKINGEYRDCHFVFIRATDIPFPTPVHAKYFDILLGMFSQNWNENGILHFRYCDVLKIAGKSSSDSKAIKETIIRYRSHLTEWNNSWGGRKNTAAFNLIRESSILENLNDSLNNNPRRSIIKDAWHTVVFDIQLIKSLKEDKKRIFLSSLYNKLNHEIFFVYRYFYGYPETAIDKKGQKRDVITWRTFDQLSHVFTWTGQINRFKPWLIDKLEKLVKLNLIDPIRWNGPDAIGIHCKNLALILPPKKEKVSLVSSYHNPTNLIEENGFLKYADSGQSVTHKPKGYIMSPKNRIEKTNKDSLSQDDILKEYAIRVKNGLVPERLLRIIEGFLVANLMEAAILNIKVHVLKN